MVWSTITTLVILYAYPSSVSLWPLILWGCLYLHCHRLAPVDAIFNRAAIRELGRVRNIFIANTEEGSTYICMFLFVLQCLANVSKVVMENGLSAMSSNIVLRKDLCEGMEGGLICICHQLHLLFYLLQQYQLFICDISYKVGRNSWQGEVTAEEGLDVLSTCGIRPAPPSPVPAAAVISKVRLYKPPAHLQPIHVPRWWWLTVTPSLLYISSWAGLCFSTHSYLKESHDRKRSDLRKGE